MLRRHPRATIALVVLLVLLVALPAVAYAAAGAYAWDQLSRVAAACGGRFADHDPSSFDPADISSEFTSSLDMTPYEMTGFQEVSFPSRDAAGYRLAGWWIPAADPAAPAVILVHGQGACRRDPVILLPAGMLHRNGFSVLLFDLRDHGDSQVEDGRYAAGTEEYLDVLGAWDWLVTTKRLDPTRVGLLGESLGGAIATIAAGEEPRVAALWEGSTYANFRSIGLEELDRIGMPRFLFDAGVFMGRVLSGDDIGAKNPDASAAKLAGRPFFIVHGAQDHRVALHHPADVAAAAQAGGTPVEPWIVPGAHHSEAAFLVPAEYEARLVDFFSKALGKPAAVAPGASAP